MVFLFSGCINWAHVVEHNQLKTIELFGNPPLDIQFKINNTTDERHSQ
jgi:hypothetical protein